MIDRSLREALSHLPRLVVFAELARQGSFRAAASALGLSPSTVTHHIKALEEALDVRLVERTSRAMTLTAAGEVLLTDAEDMVLAWRRGASTARLYATAPTGLLVVTAPDVIAERFVVPAAHRMLTQNPRVQLELRVAPRNLDLVADGIDVAVRRGPLPDSGYGARVLQRDQYGIFARPELAAQWPAEHPADLAAAPWVRYSVRAEDPELRDADGESYTLRSSTRAWASSGGAFIGMLAAGLGFGLVPKRLAEQERAAGHLVQVLPDWTWGSADFYAVTPSPRPTDAKVVRFINILAEVFEGR